MIPHVLILAATLVSLASLAHAERGIASWYGTHHEGHRMADGTPFHAAALSAAHRTLKLGSWITVTNLANGRTLDVQVRDRGPFVAGRILDLSQAAAERLEIKGLAKVDIAPRPTPTTQPAPKRHVPEKSYPAASHKTAHRAHPTSPELPLPLPPAPVASTFRG